MPGAVLTDEGVVRAKRGKDTYYRLPPEVGMLLESLTATIFKDAYDLPVADVESISTAAKMVASLETQIARKGSLTVGWKEYER